MPGPRVPPLRQAMGRAQLIATKPAILTAFPGSPLSCPLPESFPSCVFSQSYSLGSPVSLSPSRTDSLFSVCVSASLDSVLALPSLMPPFHISIQTLLWPGYWPGRWPFISHSLPKDFYNPHNNNHCFFPCDNPGVSSILAFPDGPPCVLNSSWELFLTPDPGR